MNGATAQNTSAIINLIDRKLNKPLRKPTRIDRAIKLANDRMFDKRMGLRLGVEKALVMYTDGKSHKNTIQFYADALSIKVRQFLNRSYFYLYVSENDSKHYYLLRSDCRGGVINTTFRIGMCSYETLNFVWRESLYFL